MQQKSPTGQPANSNSQVPTTRSSYQNSNSERLGDSSHSTFKPPARTQPSTATSGATERTSLLGQKVNPKVNAEVKQDTVPEGTSYSWFDPRRYMG